MNDVFHQIHTHVVHKLSMYSKDIDLYADVPDYDTAQKIATEAHNEANIAIWAAIQMAVPDTFQQRKNSISVATKSIGPC